MQSGQIEGETPSADVAGLRERLHRAEQALALETSRSRALNRIAATIGEGGDLAGVVQAVVEGGVELTGAAFGAFFYNVLDPSGDSYSLYTLAGAPRLAFERFPMPRKTEVFAPTFDGVGVVRSDDITADPRYGRAAPHHGMPEDHLPVRSYLAMPVVSRSGEVMGGLFFGHPEPARFDSRHEEVLTGLAAQAAIAIDNVRLNEASANELEVRRRAESALTDSLNRLSALAASETSTRQRLQFALQAGRLGSWELEVASRAYVASDLCKANYGRDPDEDFGFDDLVRSVHPEDRDRMRRTIEEAMRTGDSYDIEYRAIMPSTGEVRWVHVRGQAAAVGDEGGVRRMAGVSLDITERKRAEERQRLLLNELNHRVKNTLATVQSIAGQTLGSAASPELFRDAFEARILALSATHNLLTEGSWEGASLCGIFKAELDPYDPGHRRLSLEVERDVRLTPKAAVAIGMAAHELATNAAKYGALSTPGGHVAVVWWTEGPPDDRRLVLQWIETGGPPVVPPTRTGFGARLLQRGLAGELAGSVRLDYAATGLRCHMTLPMSALEAEA